MKNYTQKILPLIPKPIVVNVIPCTFQFTKDLKIFVINELENIGKQLQTYLSAKVGWKIPLVKKKDTEKLIVLEYNDDLTLPREGYHIKADEESIYITGVHAQGIFYGTQTLKQLMVLKDENKEDDKEKIWEMPCVLIRDYPRFKWRGFMLDEARHFMGVKAVKRILDLMCFHKLNVFHWHLVDDQGWRIEIKKYPKLTEISSKRKLVAKREEQPFDENKTIYGGFYSQEEIKEILTYAQERFIEVVPEIEMPGHCVATLVAYPELGCVNGPTAVPTRWGIFKDVYCPGKEHVYEFLKNVLKEIMELFPSKLIHIGGDEVIKARWRKCFDCQAKIKKENLSNVKELQTYLTNYFAKYLESKSWHLIGWNQILDENLSNNAISQYWFGKKKTLLYYLRKGRKTIMSNYLHTYLDHPYRIISVKKAYEFEPIPNKLEHEFHKYILGLEAPLWTERITSLERLDYQVFPRLTAYAETAWTPKAQKNFKSFFARLVNFSKQLDNEFGVQNSLANKDYD
ncbi:MAG: beta-N-acetylhexosaminidase [Candidatus Heimdallarchaeota archaeon]|nr:beta-N-acetylhexosaminidase [Candidatus Heimdallarchaeota archaeon]